jgi:hypothetical protein
MEKIAPVRKRGVFGLEVTQVTAAANDEIVKRREQAVSKYQIQPHPNR